MRIFISILTIAILPLILVGTKEAKNVNASPTYDAFEQKATDNTTEYCNGRYGFCLLYPADLLPVQLESANDDGVELFTENENAKVTVSGAHNIFGWVPEELLEFNMENTFPGEPKDAFIVSKVMGEDFYAISLVNEGKSIYQKVFFVEDNYVQLTIEADVNRPKLMEEIKESVELEFRKAG